MNVELSNTLAPSLNQEQILSASQIQSLNLLAMNNYELEQYIEQELIDNPFLEKAPVVSTEDSGNISFDSEDFGRRPVIRTIDDEENIPYEIAAQNTEVLADYLKAQLDASAYTEDEWRTIEFLTESFDDMGFLSMDCKEIAEWTHVSESTADKCLHIIRQLEPIGIGAKNLEECLMTQLYYNGYLDDTLKDIICNHLLDIAYGHFNKIAKATHTTTEKTKHYVSLIRQMNPRPANGFSFSNSQYIVPDIIFSKEKDGWKITFNDAWHGRLMISNAYLSLVENSNDEHAIAYCKEKIKKANFLIGAIEQRQQTILNISKYVLNYQMDFLSSKGSLKPLTLKSVSNALDIHESTVSRAIKDKYVQCPRGTRLFKTFFASGIIGKDGSVESSDALKEAIQKIIDAEDKKKPLSDQQICELLTGRGQSISRRTVAKYRTQLHIPGTFERKQ